VGWPESMNLIHQALTISDSNGMYLHSLDCEFEALRVRATVEGVRPARIPMRRLFKKAAQMRYGLLCAKIVRMQNNPARVTFTAPLKSR
jgi:hypothetical protein